MRITSKQLRQIIREELVSEAMSDDDDTVSDILSKTYGGPGPVDDFGDAGDEEFEEDEEEDEFDAVYGHTRGTLPDGRRLDPITEAMIISEVEKASRDPFFAGPDFPIYPNAYDILEEIDPSRLLRQIKKVSTNSDPRVAQTASAWFKYLKENQADAEAILHKAIYETLKHAAAMGRIDMNAKKANLRWDAQEFYVMPSGEINESRRKRH
jgi:hypothetical protein